MEKKVLFLYNEFNIPIEVRKFVEYMQHFTELGDSMIYSLINDMNNSSGTYEDIQKEKYVNQMRRHAGTVIAELAGYGIYDITEKDLVEANNGYKLLNDTVQKTIQLMKNSLATAIGDYKDQLNSAYRQASSNITGSGVSIWTSSVSSALLYSALESHTVKQQCRKADQEYREALNRISTSSHAKIDNDTKKILKDVYYPGVLDSINEFIGYMFSTYISKLNEAGIFDSGKVAQYDEDRSTDLLKNLSVVADKKPIFIEAFKKCPYNVNIYQSLIQYDYIDFDSFMTAKYFLLQDALVGQLNEHTFNHRYNNIDKELTILEEYTGKDKEVIVQELFKKEIWELKNKYHDLFVATKDEIRLIEWLENNSLYSYSADKNRILTKISSIVSEEQFKIYEDYNLIEIKDINFLDAQSKSLDEINKEYAESIYHSILKHNEKEDQKKREEKEIIKQKEEKKKQYQKKYTMIAVGFLLILCTFMYVNKVLIPGSNYRKAEKAYADRDYSTANEYYKKANGYRDSSKKIEIVNFLSDMEATEESVYIDFNNQKVNSTTKENIDKLINGNGEYGFSINANYLNAYYYYYSVDYISALPYYEKLDSSEQEMISDCPNKAAAQEKEINNRKVYDEAIKLCEDYQYEKAYKKFQTISEYSDVNNLMKKIEAIQNNKFKGLWINESNSLNLDRYLYIFPYYPYGIDDNEIWYYVGDWHNKEELMEDVKNRHFAGFSWNDFKPKASDDNMIKGESHIFKYSITYKDGNKLTVHEYDDDKITSEYAEYKK